MKRSNRLIKDTDFQAVLANKKSFKNHQFVLHIAKQKLGLTRVGLSVSKKIGNAVVRNKIRRQLRMMMATTIALNESVDYLIVVRADYLANPYAKNYQSLVEGLTSLRRKIN